MINISVSVQIKDAKRRQLKAAANEVRTKMIELAKSNLSPRSAKIYVASLTPVKFVNGAAEFKLKGWLANAIERGVNPFDMKLGMLASKKAKISKKGNPYIRVPIEDKILTVSKVSKPGSWIHPGIIARDFWSKANYIWKMKKGI